MNRRYWDALATTYEDEVLDTLGADRTGVVERWLDRLSARRAIAADFGCGIGCYTRALAARFASVQGLDHAAHLLARAEVLHHDLTNVDFIHADLTRPLRGLPRAAFGTCMNVLIAPDADLRSAILRTIHRHLLPGSPLLALVPSLESVLMTDQRVMQWYEREGLTRARAMRAVMRDEPGFIGAPAAGIVDCGGEPTKHYLLDEAAGVMTQARFAVLEVEKVECDWSHELDHPPRWLREPYPWCWLLVCRRR
jgi:SAM-dependent methyltransferase